MKLNKILFSALMLSAINGAMTSCSDSFLEEDQITQYDTSYFNTQEGLDGLVTGAYEKLKFKFNYVWAIECYNMGVDEFTDANNTMPAWNHYSKDLNSAETGANQPLWDNMFALIRAANIIVTNIPQYYDQNSDTYNTRLGEGYFLRAFAYFELVKQFGGVPLVLSYSNNVETNFGRNSAEEVYKQIISDLGEAYKLLPETASEGTGRITKYAAAHYLAKAHLFRASEINEEWNSQYVADDLDAVITYGTEVFNKHPLCKNYIDLWNYTEPNGANEKVSEVVLAAQFSNDESTWGRFGNQMHLYYPSVYQDMAGTKRDISGGREFSYVSATEYTMQVFDRINDSRFWKSFITCYGANDTNGAPVWTAKDIASGKAPAGAQKDGKRFKAGDVGIRYIVNNPGDTRFSNYEEINEETGEPVTVEGKVLKNGQLCNTHTFVRYFAGESQNWNTGTTHTGNYYSIIPHKRSVALSKFRDGYRNSIASQFGTRDAILARSADDVLMVAEAYIRKGESHYADAIAWINILRDRAAYKVNENRGVHIDGGQAYKTNTYCAGKGGGYSADGAIYSEQNTYYESNNLEGQESVYNAQSSLSGMHLNSVNDVYNSQTDGPIYHALNCTSNAEKMMCFLLNERTRELCGEGYRWEDLARTKTLDARWHAFNDGVSRGIGEFDPAIHYYRPIPQSYLDGVTNNSGAALTNEEKRALQNPGY